MCKECLGTQCVITTERNDAYTNLKTYMKEIKAVARGALRGQNGLFTNLGL
jgi:hypothetical protein